MTTEQRLSRLNHPPQTLEGPRLLHQLVDWESLSDSSALDFSTESKRKRYNYAELKSCVDNLGSTIKEALTKSEVESKQPVVPLLLPQCPALYISQLAVLEVGGAFCPINLETPEERIKFVLQDVTADVIITTREYEHVVSWQGGPIVLIVDEFPSPSEHSEHLIAIRNICSSDLAYVMYTSGSSGLPKGVGVSHLAVTQSLLAHQRHIPPFERFLQFAAPSFDVSIFEIFFPLIRGKTLVGCNRSQLLNELPGTIIRLDVDAAELTPSVAGSLLQKRSHAPCLKLLLTIGEMLTTPVIQEFGGTDSKPSMLYGMYGPTEAAIHCNINPKMAADSSPRNIGIPLNTVSNYVVKPAKDLHDASNLEFLPQGELGELLLGGPQLARGYLNRDDQNKAAFIRHDGQFYYRTGDQARMMEDGTIEIFGRISAGQVKLRGQRVELGEIEEALYKQDGVKAVCVTIITNALIAFVLLHNSRVDTESILETCSKWLPKFMVPAEVIILSEFPYLPSGKVDKRKLQSNYETKQETNDDSGDDALSVTGRAVLRVVKEAIGQFDSRVRLAACGVDSLVAIRLSSKLRELGYNISTLVALDCDTFQALVIACETCQPQQLNDITISQPQNDNPANKQNAGKETNLPCTTLQNSLLAETANNSSSYQNWVELQVTQPCSADHVVQSFISLAQHNPILRVEFREPDNTLSYHQHIRENFPPSNIQHLDEFDYDTLAYNDVLLNPVRFQLKPAGTSFSLLLHMHHAIYDAWSLELLLDDFNTLLMSSDPVSRPTIGALTRAFSAGTLLKHERISQQYWKDHLASFDVHELPNFCSNKVEGQGLVAEYSRTTLRMDAVDAAAKRFFASPQALFQAAYSLILSSYTGSSDICFGSVFSGRTLPVPGIELAVFPCFTTLPIRIDLSLSANIQDLIYNLNSTNRKHLPHSSMSLRDVKVAAGVPPGRSLFDTLLIWQQTLHDLDHQRDTLTVVNLADNLEFNLTLEIIPTTETVHLRANYQPSIISQSQVHLLLLQIEHVVQAMLDNECFTLDQAFESCPEHVLSIENIHPDITPSSWTLSSPVELIAAQDGQRLAIEFATSIDIGSCQKTSMSYQDLNTRANQIGQMLLEKGVQPNDLVCICMEKSLDLYCTILATAKIGAGYLPVVPDIPLERLKHILQEAAVRNLIINSSSSEITSSVTNLNVFDLNTFDLESFSDGNIPHASVPEDVSYCVYTSGSTGTPKGVVVTQQNLLSNLDVLEDIYPYSKTIRLLQSCSQAFDVSVFEIFFTWRVGGCLCAATKDVLFRDIEQSINSLEVTHLSLTPTVAALIDPKNVPKVEFLVTAGEAVTQRVFNLWAGHGLYQGYGPSETTNICTANPRVDPTDFINNIGKPFNNTSVFVLQPGPEFVLVPRGGIGEFCFGGSQVFRGYLNEEQNNGKITEHPEYGRLYRSGDFGRLMPDGSLAFTGRKDDQVKIRGQRVELGEINNIMLKSELVDDCVTMIVEDVNKRDVLICFWTEKRRTEEAVTILKPDVGVLSKLFEKLQATLPAYMVPSSLILVSSLPSTSQGKIDKRLLASMYRNLEPEYLVLASNSVATTQDHHAWTDLERSIAQCVSATTGVAMENITPDTSFFAFGIDSISAISLARNLRSTSGLNVEISDILKNSTVRALASKITEYSTAIVNGTSHPPAVDYGIDNDFSSKTYNTFEELGKKVTNILPCTPLQVAMLSAAQASENGAYSNKVVFNISGDMARLQECWQHMVKRHDILRTCFISTEMSTHPYVQVILQDHELNFIGNDDIATTEAEPPYSITSTNTKAQQKLVIVMHHALYDGVALENLYGEIEQLYHQESLPATVQITDFLEHVRPYDEIDKSDSFWTNVLQNLAPSKFASDIAKSTETYNVTSISLSKPFTEIEKSIKEHSTSLLAACHTAWASFLSILLQETDICFGNVVSGRTIPMEGIDRLVTPCFNTVPVRLQNLHKLSYIEAFRHFQNLNADMLPFQFTPLRQLQKRFSPDGSRLFDTLFILQQSAMELDPNIWEIEEDAGTMDFPLVIEIVPKKERNVLEITLHSHFSQIQEKNQRELLSEFERILISALDNPRREALSADLRQVIMEQGQKHVHRKDTVTQASHADVPVSEMERILRDIIAAFTDIPKDKIGRDTSIFRLGLDSISTVQIASQLRKLGHLILGNDILENPTIAKLALHLERETLQERSLSQFDFSTFDRQHRERLCKQLQVAPEQIEAIRPCTAVQRGMLAQALHSGGKDYMNSLWFELHDGISTAAFHAAWKEAVRQHEMLRTSFIQVEDSKYPFVMVTYAKDPFLSSFGSLEDNPFSTLDLVTPDSEPWRLICQNSEGRDLIHLRIHHAVYDAQSLQIILSDVAKSLKGESTQPRDLINNLLGTIIHNSEAKSQAKQDFWQKDEHKIIVNRFPDLTPLRLYDESVEALQIHSRSSTAYLEQKCRELGVTMQAATQASWARILAVYTGELSTTFGMTLSGRSILGDSDRISLPTIVTLPVRCDITGTNRELLERTMASNSVMNKHQFTPLTDIQKWSGHPEGKMFDTLFAYQKIYHGDATVELPWSIVKEEANIDYAVSMEVTPEASGEVTLRLTFKSKLIPVEHADLLLKQYDALLLDLLARPEVQCDIFSEVSKELLSITPAEQPVLSGPVTLLHDFITRGEQVWPDRIALEFATNLQPGRFQSRKWTYRDLNRESNKVANGLVDKGVVPGDLVGICFDKCAEASFAIIGIMKAGCAYVALDPTAPLDRLEYITKDSAASLVLSSGAPAKKIAGRLGADVIDMDECENFAKCSDAEPKLSRAIRQEDVSYCLYTSGTTGTPKGCLITHDNAVQAMYSFSLLFDGHWTDDSKWLQFASFHFDVSVLEQFWSWSVGICMASAPRDLIFEDIPEAIRQLGITHIDLTPSLARLVHPDDVPTLKNGVFITGGEPLKQEILDAWGEHACIYNGYGPTEATIGCTMYTRVPKNGNPSNIGPAWANAGSFVLKPGTDIPVLRGGVGELCISGKLVGKGYLNRPELTRERFPILQPFQERVYRTGDLVRILHNGNFIFLGRADDQVKLRGQRLELSEINEVVKKSTENLDQVVTLVLKHTALQKEQLVTFFVMKSQDTTADTGATILNLKSACKSKLPGYMVPTVFVPIRKLPLNANNKADAKQLAAVYNNMRVDELQSLSRSHSHDKEWTPQELELVTTIANMNGIETALVTRHSNIYELGIDSISIIGFSRSLQHAGVKNGKLSVVKSHPIIGELVKALLEDHGNAAMESSYLVAKQKISAFAQRHIVHVCNALMIAGTEIEAIAPCTPVQEGMIYKFLESDSSLYFNEFEFQLEVNVNDLWDAWDRAITKLQVLRTKFVETDDGYAQVALRSVKPCQRREYLNNTPLEKNAALTEPFQLAMRTLLVGATMKMRIFHGLYDGNSLTMLLKCVVDEFRHIGDVQYGPEFHSVLPYGPLTLHETSKSFWEDHLASWSPTHLPLVSQNAQDIYETEELYIDGLESFRKRLGVSHQAIIQAVWLAVLQEILSPSLTIGLVTSGRTIDFENANQVIGPLFNTLPFHAVLRPNSTFSDLIRSCHESNLRMQPYQHSALKDVQKWSPAKPGQSLFDTLFVFQRPEVEDEGFADGVWRIVDDRQVADYPLAFEATLSPDSKRLKLVIVAQGKYLTESLARDLLVKFEDLFQELLGTQGTNIIDFYKSDMNGETDGVSVPHSERKTNGINGNNGTNGGFIWTDQAIFIREELSLLTNMSPDAIDEHSSVFELGLDSIDIIKLSSRLKKRSINLAVSVIIKAQSISNLVSRMDENSKSITRAAHLSFIASTAESVTDYLSPRRDLTHVENILPATPLQEAMVNEMNKSDYARYFNVESFQLQDNVSLARLEEAVRLIINNSPILRTNFEEVHEPGLRFSFAQLVHTADSPYTQNIVSSKALDIKENIETCIHDFKREAKIQAKQHQALFQVQFVSGSGTNYFLMAISHALYDGTSLRALHDDFSSAYKDNFKRRPDHLSSLEQVFQSTTDEATNFWKTTLTNLPRTQFPQCASEMPADVRRHERKSKWTMAEIEAACRSYCITLQTLGQSCWALVLAHYTKQLDVAFGSVLACRDTEEARDVMFPLMNTVVVRSVIHGTAQELLTYMQNMGDSIRQHQHFPLGRAQSLALASTTSREEQPASTSLFDTLFIYQGRRSTTSNKALYNSISTASDVEFPVCVEMEVVDDHHLTWTIACKSVADVEVEQIVEMLDHVLGTLLEFHGHEVLNLSADGISICGFQPFVTRQEFSSSPTPHTNGTKSKEIWSKIETSIRESLHKVSHVPLEDIKKDTSIFYLGLDSILVLKLPALLKKQGIKLRVSEILKEQTIERMAKAVQSASRENPELIDVDTVLANSMKHIDTNSIRRKLEYEASSIEEIIPVTSGMLFMLRQWQASGGALFYSTFELEIADTLSREDLNRAWRELQHRHTILRTGFHEVDGEWLQIIYEHPLVDILYNGELLEKHNLSRPPVYLSVSHSEDKLSCVKLTIHHALYDGISLPSILEQLESLYQGDVPALPNLKFRDFVANSVQASRDPLTKMQWQTYLKTADYVLTSSTSMLQKESRVEESRVEVFKPATSISNLRQRAQSLGVSTDSMLLAVAARSRFFQCHGSGAQSYILIGIYHSNRAPFGADLSLLFAPTLNLLPLIIHRPTERPIEEVARDIQNDLQKIGSVEMSSVSLEQIYEWTGKRIDYWVNIVKDTGEENDMENGKFWKTEMARKERATIVPAKSDARIFQKEEEQVYLPSIDIELRYHSADTGATLDIGVFALEELLDLHQADQIIQSLVKELN